MRTTGSFVTSTTLGEAVRAFVPHPLPPADPPLDPACYRRPIMPPNWRWPG